MFLRRGRWAGDADLTVSSEIVPVYVVKILVRSREIFDYDDRFAAGASSMTKNPYAANTLIRFLAGPKALPPFIAKGLESL